MTLRQVINTIKKENDSMRRRALGSQKVWTFSLALDIATDILEMHIPRKPIPDGYKDKCPVCGLVVKFGEHYCKGCGQKLRWNE